VWTLLSTNQWAEAGTGHEEIREEWALLADPGAQTTMEKLAALHEVSVNTVKTHVRVCVRS
jgi:hypothetical protein